MLTGVGSGLPGVPQTHSARLLGRWLSQERSGLKGQLLRQPLQALERQVSLAAFQAAHVGAVDAELVGEGFLAEAAGLPVGA